MAFVPVPNVIQIELRGTKAGQHVENRWFVDAGHAPVAADFAALANLIFTRVRADWLTNLPLDYVLTELFLRSMQSANAIQVSVPAVSGDIGTFTGVPAPNQNTFCISLRTGSAGRSARGRLYWQGLSEDHYNTNAMLPGPRTAITAAVDAMRAALATLGMPWVIVSFISEGAPRVGGPVLFPVLTVLTVNDILDSQRRRMPGHGT